VEILPTYVVILYAHNDIITIQFAYSNAYNLLTL